MGVTGASLGGGKFCQIGRFGSGKSVSVAVTVGWSVAEGLGEGVVVEGISEVEVGWGVSDENAQAARTMQAMITERAECALDLC